MDYIGGNYDTKKTKQYPNQLSETNQLVWSGLQFGIEMFLAPSCDKTCRQARVIEV